MEALVERIVKKYPRFLQEEAIFERHLEKRENSDMRGALTLVRIKLGMIESWFSLLDTDERFALRQMLTPNSGAAMQAAAMIWSWQLCQEGQTPAQVRARAIGKIASFAWTHRKLMRMVFGDVWRG